MRIKNRFLLLCAIFTIVLKPLLAQKSRVDSLQKALKACGTDTCKVNTLNNLAIEVGYSNFDTAIIISTEALKISEKANWKVGVACSERLIGSFYTFSNDIKNSQAHLNRALHLFDSLSQLTEKKVSYAAKMGRALALFNLGRLEYIRGDNSAAAALYLKGLDLGTEISSKYVQCIGYASIMGSTMFRGEISKSIEQGRLALKLSKEMNNRFEEARALCNLGNALTSLGRFDDAIDTLNLSLKMTEQNNYQLTQAIVFDVLGYNKLRQKKYEDALRYLFLALAKNKEIHFKTREVDNLRNIGMTYLEMNKKKLAEEYLVSSIELAKANGQVGAVTGASSILYQLYLKDKKYELALNYFTMSVVSRDSMNKVSGAEKLLKMEMNKEFEKKEAIAKTEYKNKLENQRILAEASSRTQKAIIWSVGIGLVLMIIFAAFVLRSLRITSQQKKIIDLKNKETEQQKKLVEEKAAEVAVKQKEIIDSIKYASRIQRALITSEKYIAKNLKRMSQKM